MFWKFNTTASPQFESVLSKENVTLQELMEEEDIIQECKSQNKKLVDFLCQRNILEELVTLITEEPPEELDERSRFKYANIACELLTCDVPSLNESLSRDNALLEKLYSFIDKDPPLNPLLASFLSRTLGVLIVKRIDQHWISYQFTCLQAMGFLKDKENFISLLLKHLGTSAIMDLTLKLITEVGDDEHRQNLLNWLDSQNLVQSLVGLFDPKVDNERQNNASQLICDVLRISRDVVNDHRDRLYTDLILVRLESPETVSLLLDHMLGTEKSESSIVGGIQILLALLGHKNSPKKSRWRIIDSFNDNNLLYNNAYDEAEVERKQKIAQSTAHVIVGRLKDFHSILLDPPKKNMILKTSIGSLDPPLGNTRLQVTKLLACLIGLDNPEVLREIIRLQLIQVLLDLFFKYIWNNFLHAQVQQCIFAALQVHLKSNNDNDNENDGGDVDVDNIDDDTSDNLMYPYLILKCRLLGRILEAWDDNEQKQIKPKGIRQGYMGHLINIANEIVQQCEQNNSFNQYIIDNVAKDTLEAWNNFVNGPLAETNKTQRVVLGGIHPRNLTGDDSEDYSIPYPQAAILQQQMYTEFQMQQMIPDLNSSIFHDDEFNNQDDSSIISRRVNIDMMTESDLSRQAEMLKKVCTDLSSTLDDDSDDIIFDEERVFIRKHAFQNEDDDDEDDVDDEDADADAVDDNTVTPTTATTTTTTTTTTTDANKQQENINTEISIPQTMVVDPWPKSDGGNNSNSNIIVGEASNPWATIDTKNTTQEDGWADFGSFTTDFSSEPFTTDPFAFTTNSPSRTSIASLPLENDQSSGDQITTLDAIITETEQEETKTSPIIDNSCCEENVGDNEHSTTETAAKDESSKLPIIIPPIANIETVVISNSNTTNSPSKTIPTSEQHTIDSATTIEVTQSETPTTATPDQLSEPNANEQSSTSESVGGTESV